MNWKIIESNLREAKEQIETSLKQIKDGESTEVRLRFDLEHATHHLYFAWNARHETSKNYSKLTDTQFNEWSKIPKDLGILKVKLKRKKAQVKLRKSVAKRK